jgi:hypothetical protein
LRDAQSAVAAGIGKDGADGDRNLIRDRVLVCDPTSSVGYKRPRVSSKTAGVRLYRMCVVRGSAHGVRPRAVQNPAGFVPPPKTDSFRDAGSRVWNRRETRQRPV